MSPHGTKQASLGETAHVRFGVQTGPDPARPRGFGPKAKIFVGCPLQPFEPSIRRLTGINVAHLLRQSRPSSTASQTSALGADLCSLSQTTILA
jgi:hypothetical protein